MKPSTYYELRCAVLEMFYETLLAEHYTIGQAASRCLVEFRREVNQGGREALVALSVILSRVARHESAALARFQPEVDQLRVLAKKPSCRRGLASEEQARLQEDVRFLLEKAAQSGN